MILGTEWQGGFIFGFISLHIFKQETQVCKKKNIDDAVIQMTRYAVLFLDIFYFIDLFFNNWIWKDIFFKV